jgi:hypothetical protein
VEVRHVSHRDISTWIAFRFLRIAPGIAGVCCLLLAGCGADVFESEESIALDKVPPAVMRTAREQLPDITFQQAFKIEADGKQIYEVRGTDASGRLREVEVFASGELFQVE